MKEKEIKLEDFLVFRTRDRILDMLTAKEPTNDYEKGFNDALEWVMGEDLFYIHQGIYNEDAIFEDNEIWKSVKLIEAINNNENESENED